MKNVTYALASAVLILAAQPAAAADRVHTESLISRSLTALQKADWASGARLAREALKSDRLSGVDALTATTSLCVQSTNAESYVDAVAACDTSIALSPERWGGYLNRANLRLMMGDRTGALADYETAKSLGPQDGTADRSMARITQGLGGHYVALFPGATSHNLEQRAEVE
jgi:hypothetical protein